MMETTTRKRGNTNPTTNNNDDNLDVEGGGNSEVVQEEEREELLARYIRRRAKDIHDMVMTGNFYGIVDTLRPFFDVDTSDFIRKLIYSLFPNIPTSRQSNNSNNEHNYIHKRYT